MENTREKNKRADGRKKTYFDRENKKKAARTEKTKSVAPEKGKQKKSSSSSKCPYQKKCGGCTYLNLSYEEQLAKKEQFLKKTLKGIVPVKGMVGMENPYHYRNKVNSAFARKKDGTIISGIYEKGTHKVVPVDECLLEDQRADAIIRDIRSLLKSFKIMIYNEDSGYGLLRPVKKQLRKGPAQTPPGDHHDRTERQRPHRQHGTRKTRHCPLRTRLHRG